MSEMRNGPAPYVAQRSVAHFEVDWHNCTRCAVHHVESDGLQTTRLFGALHSVLWLTMNHPDPDLSIVDHWLKCVQS
jgi:hypothetical protein